MTRRTLGLMLALTVRLLVAPLALHAQPQGNIPTVGVLEPGPPPTVAPAFCLEAFRHGLGELGYRQGHNVALEERYAAFTPDRLLALAAELVQRQPQVIWTHSNLAAWALKRATTTIPVVVAVSSQIVEQGLVASLTQPGGNLTGLESQSVEQTSKRLELLKEALPQLTRVALLLDPASHGHGRLSSAFEAEARTLGIELLPIEARDPGAFEGAFAAMVAHRADALVVIDNAMFARHAPRLAALALAHRLPSMAATRNYAQAGGLIAYGVYPPELCRRSAAYVDKILKGAHPGDLPVERSMKFELFINLNTAQALGLTIPPALLFQADGVIR